VSTALICFIFWLLITGQVVSLLRGEPAPQVLIAGAVVSIGAALFSARFFIHEKPFYLCNPARLLKLLVYAICIFPIELCKANVDVARRALSPSLPINPGIVKIPVGVKSEYAQAMLADSITLTPGTITMDIVEEEVEVEEDLPAAEAAETAEAAAPAEGEAEAPAKTVKKENRTYYYVHWIDVASQNENEAGDAIKGTLESWVRRIWE